MSRFLYQYMIYYTIMGEHTINIAKVYIYVVYLSYMPHADFIINFDPEKDTENELVERIIYALFISRVRAKKPCIVFMGGDSGEGKSISVLTLMMIMMKLQNIHHPDWLSVCNIHTPLQYPTKIKKLLFDPEYKKLNMVAIHEARNVVKAKQWNTFLTQSIADVNAMSRSVKRMVTFVVSQFIKDIASDIRYTINYYIIAERPKGRMTRLKIFIIWKDDRDLEKPKLRKRRIHGYLRLPDGRLRKYKPLYIELDLPSKEIVEAFDNEDTEAKGLIIKNKLDKILKEIKADIGQPGERVEAIVNYYIEHLDQLSIIGKQSRGKWKLKGQISSMYDFNDLELRIFEEKLNKNLKEKGLFKAEEVTDGFD